METRTLQIGPTTVLVGKMPDGQWTQWKDNLSYECAYIKAIAERETAVRQRVAQLFETGGKWNS